MLTRALDARHSMDEAEQDPELTALRAYPACEVSRVTRSGAASISPVRALYTTEAT